MNSFKKILLSRLSLITIILLVILTAVLIYNHYNNTTAKISDICSSQASSYGSDTLSVSVPKTNNYIVWIHLVSPLKISYVNLVGTYNPLFVIIDGNKPCYKVGGSPNMPINTWIWVNYLNNNPSQLFRVSLTKGNHHLIIVGRYASVDKIEVLKQNCTPTKNVSSCLES